MCLLSLHEIADLLEAPRPSCDLNAAHFCIDSRQVRPGSLFFALKGQKVNGHRFVKEALARGAVAAVVSEECGADPVIRVADVTGALQKLARWAASRRGERVVAITGSMGKTTTKEFLATLLEARYRVYRTPGNQNTQVSVPLILLNLAEAYDVLVIEMGMSAHGHIQKLVEIVPPDLAIITRIAPAGIEGLVGGLDAVARAKSEIFLSPRTRLGLISAQAAEFEPVRIRGGAFKQVYASQGSYTTEEGGVRIEDEPLLPLKLRATHLVENAVGAIYAARNLGLSWEEIAGQTGKLKPFDKRFEVVEKGGVTYVQDCYNANPDSVIAALENLPACEGRVIGVLGTMPGLGEKSESYHTQVGQQAAVYLDRLICIGQEAEPMARAFAQSGKPLSYFPTLQGVAKVLKEVVCQGDVLLIKGGNFLKLWTLLEDVCCCS